MARLDHRHFSTNTASETKSASKKKQARSPAQVRWDNKFRFSIGNDMNMSLLLPLQVTDYLHLKHMSTWSRCANEDKKIIKKLPLFDYVDAHYIDLHPPLRTKKGRAPERRIAIVLDVDSNIRPSDMREIGMPMPKTFTANSANFGGRSPSDPEPSEDFSVNRPHLIYWLHTPIWMDDYEQANQYRLIARRLARLVGTISYVEAVNPITTKNPAKLRHYSSEQLYWDVVEGDNRTWTLAELDEAITEAENAPIHPAQITYTPPPKAKKTSFRSADGSKRATHAAPFDGKGSDQSYLERTIGASFDEEYAARGKNCNLFSNIRYLAYAFKAKASSEEHLYRYMLQQCAKYNETKFSDNLLPDHEIHETAKSISWWTWNVYSGSGSTKDRGACKRAGLINDSMEIDERQAIGGRYAAKQNADKKRQIVLDAVSELRAAGDKIVVSQLAKKLGVSRNTINKYLPDAAKKTAQEAAQKTSSDVTIEQLLGNVQNGVIRGNQPLEPEGSGATKPDLFPVGGPDIEGYGILSSIWSDCSEVILQRGHQEGLQIGSDRSEIPPESYRSGFSGRESNKIPDLGIYYPTRLPIMTAQTLGGARQIILGLGSRSMGRQSGTYFFHSSRVLS
ncbi:primase C-terminal domain-containing protein [Sulfitobacter delicatus]|uniref:Primase C terminal 1 (PriCT-1) n=1 Tax=Sulfitobacter delicatus TaxID=218672 RepID=A0A1G7XFR8_9RHOB|nr:primase C-terminal domain-containing protein [Sulfitobacter delicatus]SDG83062.1 Primase C terminal 1 (PriCT-1) [Sulfitobacter delicatus]